MLTTSKNIWLKSLRGADLTNAEFRVLMVVSTYTDAQGQGAHPGLDKIIADARMDRRSVRRHLAALCSKGWLKLVKKGGNHVAYRAADEYELMTPGQPKGRTTTPLPDIHKERTPTPLDADEEGVLVEQEGVFSRSTKGRTTTPPSSRSRSGRGNSSSRPGRERSAARTGSLRDPKPLVLADAEIEVIDDYAIATPPPGKTWEDLIEDYDLLEKWLEDELDLANARDHQTALGMWEAEAHPRAIFNKIRFDQRRPA